MAFRLLPYGEKWSYGVMDNLLARPPSGQGLLLLIMDEEVVKSKWEAKVSYC